MWIFDWLREQIGDHLNHCREMEAQSRTKFEEFGYGSRVDAYSRAIEYINEAEIKWKPQKIIKTYLHPRGSIIGDCPRCENGVLAGSKFCRFCGIPLEVE